MVSIVVKRNGRRHPFDARKLYDRITLISDAKEREDVDFHRIVGSVERALPDVITADALDDLLAEKTAELSYVHPSYDLLAGRVELEILKRTTPDTFSAACDILGSGPTPTLTSQFMSDLSTLKRYLDIIVENSCCRPYTYSALKAMEHTYLLKKDGQVIELPNYMFMRVALHLHRFDVTRISKTYELLLHHAYTHATPTMANAGTVSGQLSSCFILSVETPFTTTGLYRTLAESAAISTATGGIGIDFNACPSVGASTGGSVSLGLPPVLQLFEASLSVNVSGQSRRPSAVTGYLEPWHQDVFAVINMRRNRSTRDGHLKKLFQAMWVPDLFMSRVHNDEQWSLFSPHVVPHLVGCYGATFEARYVAYEMDPSVPRVTVPARSVMYAITQAQIETGGPFVLFKDTINMKNNQSNMGTITHSNLCTEIVQYSSSTETAVCNLASIILPSYVHGSAFDYDELHDVVKTVTYNLNRVIDSTSCPTDSATRGNLNQRALGIGIQGLADMFIALGIPYQSQRARVLNRDILETIYHAAMSASVDYARIHGCYPSFSGSPLSQGRFQFDMWHKRPTSGRYDWNALRHDVAAYGVANSLLVALMPTSGTSQITGCTESFEPIQSNVFTRHVLSGEYRVLSPALVRALENEKLWSENLRLKIIRSQGSIQDIAEIPTRIKAVFKTGWEIGPQSVIDLAVDRAPFVCQSQSMSLYISSPTQADLMSMHFYTWRSGLKTGMYYLRTKPAAAPLQYTVPFSSPRYAVSEASPDQSPSSASFSTSSSSASHSPHDVSQLSDSALDTVVIADAGPSLDLNGIDLYHTDPDDIVPSFDFLEDVVEPTDGIFSPFNEELDVDGAQEGGVCSNGTQDELGTSPVTCCDSCGA